MCPGVEDISQLPREYFGLDMLGCFMRFPDCIDHKLPLAWSGSHSPRQAADLGCKCASLTWTHRPLKTRLLTTHQQAVATAGAKPRISSPSVALSMSACGMVPSDLFPVYLTAPHFSCLGALTKSSTKPPSTLVPSCHTTARFFRKRCLPLGSPGNSNGKKKQTTAKKNKTKKTLPANAGDAGLVPGSGRSPEEGNGNPFQYSCLDNPMDRGAWWATVCGAAESRSWLQVSRYMFLYCNSHSTFYTMSTGSWYSYHQDTSWDFKKQNGLFLPTISVRGFPDGLVVKNLPANRGDSSYLPWSGRFPGEGNGKPLQYSWLEKPMDSGASQVKSPWSCKESDVTWRLSIHISGKSRL